MSSQQIVSKANNALYVTAYFGNGIAEQAIREVHEKAWTYLPNAWARCLEVINLATWSCALRDSVYIYNAASS